MRRGVLRVSLALGLVGCSSVHELSLGRLPPSAAGSTASGQSGRAGDAALGEAGRGDDDHGGNGPGEDDDDPRDEAGSPGR